MNTGHFQVCIIIEHTHALSNEAKYTWTLSIFNRLTHHTTYKYTHGGSPQRYGWLPAVNFSSFFFFCHCHTTD